MGWIDWLAGYCALMSLVSFIQFGMDKRRAQKHQWRIPEKILFLDGHGRGITGSDTGNGLLSP